MGPIGKGQEGGCCADTAPAAKKSSPATTTDCLNCSAETTNRRRNDFMRGICICYWLLGLVLHFSRSPQNSEHALVDRAPAIRGTMGKMADRNTYLLRRNCFATNPNPRIAKVRSPNVEPPSGTNNVSTGTASKGCEEASRIANVTPTRENLFIVFYLIVILSDCFCRMGHTL